MTEHALTGSETGVTVGVQSAHQPRIRTPLLTDQVQHLKLDRDAKFISQQEETFHAAQDHKQMILAWRRAQERTKLKEVK